MDNVEVIVDVHVIGGERIGRIRSVNPYMVRVPEANNTPRNWGTENPLAPGLTKHLSWPIEIRAGKCIIEIKPTDEKLFYNLLIPDA